MRIDSHQHFWIYDAIRDSWITEEKSLLQRDFLPNDLAPLLRENNIDGVVAVQADQSQQETQFLVDLSTVYAMIKAVVGWVDLSSDEIEKHLESFARYSIIKGFRHIVEGEEDGDFLMREDIQRGIRALTKFGYTYDLLIRPIHYQSTLACIEANPDQQFILDHMAKPAISTSEFEEWASFIMAISVYPNVACKISGLAAEADWQHWQLADFAPYIDHVISHFGKDRVLFGSDWPVCLVAASYEENLNIVSSRLSSFTEDEKKAFWGENARRIYNIT